MYMEDFLGRNKEIAELVKFIEESSSGFTYVRGRRRVGKTWVLKFLEKKYAENKDTLVFYYMGSRKLDENAERKNFSEEWHLKSGDSSLRELAEDYRSWKRIFSGITDFAASNKSLKLVLVFDEIQWLVKNSDLVSRIKEVWVDWELLSSIKVIICGSSSRFFKKKALAAEAVLRGLRTRSSIWIKEFSPVEIRKYYLQDWLLPEVALTYMMFGGVPYYYSNINVQTGFIQAINKFAFTSSSILPEEVDEMLNLEFNAQGTKTVKKILQVVGQQGSTISKIAEKSGLALSTVSDAVADLVEFDLLFSKYPLGNATPQNSQGVKYYLRDFFLNFYFQVLSRFEKIIQANDQELLFPVQALNNLSGYYIANFSGHAFELLCANYLRNFYPAPIHSLLELVDPNFSIGYYWDKNQEIDFIVEGETDRIARITECKWIDSKINFKEACIQLKQKSYSLPKGFSSKYYLFVSVPVSAKQQNIAREQGVKLISLESFL